MLVTSVWCRAKPPYCTFFKVPFLRSAGHEQSGELAKRRLVTYQQHSIAIRPLRSCQMVIKSGICERFFVYLELAFERFGSLHGTRGRAEKNACFAWQLGRQPIVHLLRLLFALRGEITIVDGNSIVDQGTNGIADTAANGVDDVVARETTPPYPVPLRGIQVRLRIMDRDTRQVRQMTVSSDFIPE